MELQDALIVSLSGYTVVFFGLLVMSLIIYSFGAIPKWLKWFKDHKDRSAVEVKTIPVEPDILAVIATVIEVERRLRTPGSTRRYTFKDRRKSSGLV